MEGERFDALIRETYDDTTRRGALRIGVGALAASLAAMGWGLDDIEAKKKKKGKKKKKKKKERCTGNRPVTCGNGCCPSNFSQCCENASEPVNPFTCNPSDFTCCSLDEGGGSCPPDQSQCCPPTTQEPFGSCAESTATCCTSEQGGGSCPAEIPTCCTFDCCEADAECCGPEGSCPTGFVCEVEGEQGFCCVPEALETAGGQRRASSRKQRNERFRMKAK